MGRKSVKENKSVYQQVREELGLTREKAGELIDGLSAEKIEKIENERVALYPDDVLLMANGYKAPQLCNYYCTRQCPIGRTNVPVAEMKSISQIAVETVNSVNQLKKEQEKLFEIIADGQITEDEYEKFTAIKNLLDDVARSSSELRLWLDKKIADGEIAPDVTDTDKQ